MVLPEGSVYSCCQHQCRIERIHHLQVLPISPVLFGWFGRNVNRVSPLVLTVPSLFCRLNWLLFRLTQVSIRLTHTQKSGNFYGTVDSFFTVIVESGDWRPRLVLCWQVLPLSWVRKHWGNHDPVQHLFIQIVFTQLFVIYLLFVCNYCGQILRYELLQLLA